LNSHRKKVRFFLYITVVVCVLIAGVNISVSVILNRTFKEMQQLSGKAVPGFYFNVRFAYFNVLRGVTMYGLECRKDGALILGSRRSDIGFDVLSLKDRKVRIKNIHLRQARLDLSKVSDLAPLWDKALWKMELPFAFFETTYFSGQEVWLSDTAHADIKGYFSRVKGGLWISRGDIALKKIYVPAFPETDLFGGSPFYKPFDYIFEGTLEGPDFTISRFEMSNAILKFTGRGRIEDVDKDPRCDMEMDFMNIVLDDFAQLNTEHVKSRGVLDARLKIAGPARNAQILLNINVANGEVNFFDSLFLSKIHGRAVASRDHIVGQDFSLFINNIPLSANFAVTEAKACPHFLLRLFSSVPSEKGPAFIFDLEADSLDEELVGKARMRMRYVGHAVTNTVSFELDDFHLGYADELFISAEGLKAQLSASPLNSSSNPKVLDRTFRLTHPFCVLRRGEEGFVLDNIKGVCYGGTLEGKTNFIPDGSKLSVSGEAHLREVNLGEFFQSTEDTVYALLGKMDADLRFDTRSVDMLKGQLFITEGIVEQNPLLNAVSDFLGVPSLKKVSFDELSVFFSGGRGEYTSSVKLESPSVKGHLDGKISTYDKMDGYLGISLTTQLLNESKQFKKVLTYIRHDEPSVNFSFKISSYLSSPRVLWLKNEFKEKLSILLPERNKRSMQRQVNTMVEKMEAE
jgi:hypothetical protein